MNILGVIAELNPLHKGHEYLIKSLRRETGADYCVAVMSGDYVQRGEPAFFEKSLRAQAALLSGVDLVLELPLAVSTGSAEYFALGSVSLLHRLGCVTHLGFGSESGDIHALKAAGRLLSKEPEAYRALLQRFLKEGMNFPRARYEALRTYHLGECHSDSSPVFSLSDSTTLRCGAPRKEEILSALSLLTAPNNILGAEYCKALYLLRSPIVPVTLKRAGAGYHEDISDTVRSDRNAETPDTQTNPAQQVHYASASGLRNAFLSYAVSGRDFSASERDGLTPTQGFAALQMKSLLQNHVPKSCIPLYLEALQKRRHVTFDDLFLPLYYTLQYSDAETLGRYQDVTPAFAERLFRLFRQASSTAELCALSRTKNVTSARISRCLLHILLHLTKDAVAAQKEQGFALYARILGFRREAEPLLSLLKKTSAVPLVSKLADAEKILPPPAFSQLLHTAKASELYRAAMPNVSSGSEYAQKIVIV